MAARRPLPRLSPFRVPACASLCTLNRHRPVAGHSNAAARALQSSLLATGRRKGKGLESAVPRDRRFSQAWFSVSNVFCDVWLCHSYTAYPPKTAMAFAVGTVLASTL